MKRKFKKRYDLKYILIIFNFNEFLLHFNYQSFYQSLFLGGLFDFQCI